jgi:hypothetical protein
MNQGDIIKFRLDGNPAHEGEGKFNGYLTNNICVILTKPVKEHKVGEEILITHDEIINLNKSLSEELRSLSVSLGDTLTGFQAEDTDFYLNKLDKISIGIDKLEKIKAKLSSFSTLIAEREQGNDDLKADFEEIDELLK